MLYVFSLLCALLMSSYSHTAAVEDGAPNNHLIKGVRTSQEAYHHIRHNLSQDRHWLHKVIHKGLCYPQTSKAESLEAAYGALRRINRSGRQQNDPWKKAKARAGMGQILAKRGLVPSQYDTPAFLESIHARLQSVWEGRHGNYSIDTLVAAGAQSPKAKTVLYSVGAWLAALKVDLFNKGFQTPATLDPEGAWAILNTIHAEKWSASKVIFLFKAGVLIKSIGTDFNPFDTDDGRNNAIQALFNQYRAVSYTAGGTHAQGARQAPTHVGHVRTKTSFPDYQEGRSLIDRVRAHLEAHGDIGEEDEDAAPPAGHQPSDNSDEDDDDPYPHGHMGGGLDEDSHHGDDDDGRHDGPDAPMAQPLPEAPAYAAPLAADTATDNPAATTENEDSPSISPLKRTALARANMEGDAAEEEAEETSPYPHAKRSMRTPVPEASSTMEEEGDDSDDDMPIVRRKGQRPVTILDSSDEEDMEEQVDALSENGMVEGTNPGSEEALAIRPHSKITPAKSTKRKGLQKNADRDAQIIRLKGEGHSLRQIASLLNEQYPGLTHANVSHVLRREGLGTGVKRAPAITHTKKQQIIDLYQSMTEASEGIAMHEAIAQKVGCSVKQVGRTINDYRVSTGKVKKRRSKEEIEALKEGIIQAYLSQQEECQAGRLKKVDISAIAQTFNVTKGYVSSKVITPAVNKGRIRTTAAHLSKAETDKLKAMIRAQGAHTKRKSEVDNQAIADAFNKEHFGGRPVVMAWRVNDLRSKMHAAETH